jgi:hypothetical protein
MIACHSCGTTVRVDVFVTPAGAVAECDRCLFRRIPPQAPVVGPMWTANEDHFGGLAYTR